MLPFLRVVRVCYHDFKHIISLCSIWNLQHLLKIKNSNISQHMLLITSQSNLKSNLILQNVLIYNKQLVTGTKNSTQVCKLQNGMSQQKPNNLKKKNQFSYLYITSHYRSKPRLQSIFHKIIMHSNQLLYNNGRSIDNNYFFSSIEIQVGVKV